MTSPSAPPTTARQCTPSWKTTASRTGPGSFHALCMSFSTDTRAWSSSQRCAAASRSFASLVLDGVEARSDASSSSARCSRAAWLTSNAFFRSFVRLSTSPVGHKSYARLVPTFHTPDGFGHAASTRSLRFVVGDSSSRIALSSVRACASTRCNGTSPAPEQSIISTTLLGPSRPNAAGSTPVSRTATRTLRPS